MDHDVLNVIVQALQYAVASRPWAIGGEDCSPVIQIIPVH